MQRFVLVTLVTVLSFGVLVLGTMPGTATAESDTTFQALRCGGCHKPDQKGAGPTLKEITQAYAGRQDRLVRYFMGESEPVIDTGKKKMMESALKKIQAVSEEERKGLADYVLSFK